MLNILKKKSYRKYVLVIARSRVQYEKYFSSKFCFRHISRAEGEWNIGNKIYEKNKSHIAWAIIAITSLSHGMLNFIPMIHTTFGHTSRIYSLYLTSFSVIDVSSWKQENQSDYLSIVRGKSWNLTFCKS